MLMGKVTGRLDLNCNCKVIKSSISEVLTFHVVVLTFLESNPITLPVRVGCTISKVPEVSIRIVVLVVIYLSRVFSVHWRITEVDSALVVTSNIEPIVGSSWSYEPSSHHTAV